MPTFIILKWPHLQFSFFTSSLSSNLPQFATWALSFLIPQVNAIFIFSPALLLLPFLFLVFVLFKVIPCISFIFPRPLFLFFIVISFIFIYLAWAAVEFPFAFDCLAFIILLLIFSKAIIFQAFSISSFVLVFTPFLFSSFALSLPKPFLILISSFFLAFISIGFISLFFVWSPSSTILPNHHYFF